MSDQKPTQNNNANQKNWKTVAAYIYLTICIFDFVIMPVLTFFFHAPPASLISLINTVSPSVQPDLIRDFYGPWQPLTEADDGLFHIIFMTLLGVISWRDNSKEVEIAKTESQKHIETLKAKELNNSPVQSNNPVQPTSPIEEKPKG